MFLLYSFGNLGYVFVLFIWQFKLLGGELFICAYANAICAYAHQKRVIFFNAMVIYVHQKRVWLAPFIIRPINKKSVLGMN